MNRRNFILSAGAGATATSTFSKSLASAVAPSAPVLMKLGDQTKPTDDTHLKYLARYSVRNICGYPEIKDGRLYATVDELKSMVDMAAKYGISVDCTAPPFLESTHIDTEKHPAIMLADSPERDRDIEAIQTFIRNCAQAGIPSIKYNMSLLGVETPWMPYGTLLKHIPKHLSRRPVPSMRMPSGSASHTFSIASFR